jgi:hypothetical protein
MRYQRISVICITVSVRQMEHGHPHLHQGPETMTNAPKSSRRDHLTTTTDESKIDLTEEELSRVTGGRKAGGSQFLTYKLPEVLISGY